MKVSTKIPGHTGKKGETIMSKIFTMIEPEISKWVYWNGYEWAVKKHIIFDDGKTGYLLHRSWFTIKPNHEENEVVKEEYEVVKCEDVEKYEALSDMADKLTHQALCDRRDREIAEKLI